MSEAVGTARVKRGMAEMLKGGVIMDVVNAEQAKIAQDAGACAVMALERVPADIRDAQLFSFLKMQLAYAALAALGIRPPPVATTQDGRKSTCTQRLPPDCLAGQKPAPRPKRPKPKAVPASPQSAKAPYRRSRATPRTCYPHPRRSPPPRS